MNQARLYLGRLKSHGIVEEVQRCKHKQVVLLFNRANRNVCDHDADGNLLPSLRSTSTLYSLLCLTLTNCM